jgi:hypothetical protein
MKVLVKTDMIERKKVKRVLTGTCAARLSLGNCRLVKPGEC